MLFQLQIEIFEVNNPETMQDDEWNEYHGIAYWDAAEAYAKHYNDNGDYLLMDEEIVINVRKKGEDKIVQVAISAEATINYCSHVIKEIK